MDYRSFNHGSYIDHGLWIIQLWIMDYRSWIMDHGLWIIQSYRLSYWIMLDYTRSYWIIAYQIILDYVILDY